MTPRRAVYWGLAAGSVAAGILLFLVASFFTADENEQAAGRPADAVPLHLRPGAAPPPAPPRSRVQRVEVQVYQRGPYDSIALVPVSAEIVYFKAIEDRLRQVVDHVLAGVPNDVGAVPPTSEGIACREVYVDPRGVAWIDLDGSTVDKIVGSDEEQSLIAALALSLVTEFDEVARVGVLVDGAPRRTLAGHLDLRRTYTGREWEVVEVDTPPGVSGGSAADDEVLEDHVF